MQSVQAGVTENLLLLEALWKDIGYFEGNGSYRDEYRVLSEEINEPILRRLKESQKRREELLLEVSKMKVLILEVKASLGDTTPLSKNESHSIPKHLNELKSLLEALNIQRDERRAIIGQLHTTLNEHCFSLDKTIEDMFPLLLSQKNSPKVFHNTLARLLLTSTSDYTTPKEDLSLQRIEKFKESILLAHAKVKELKEQITQCKQQIQELWDELDFTEEKRQIHPVDEFVGQKFVFCFFSKKNEMFYSLSRSLDLLRTRREELQEAYNRLFGAVKELMPKIYDLWILLKVDQKDHHRLKLWYSVAKIKNPSVEAQEDFLKVLAQSSSKKRFSTQAIDACESEYQRLRLMEEERLKELILIGRKKLSVLWDKLHFGKNQRELFVPGFSEEYTRETLTAIKQEIKRLTALWTTVGALLKQIERREEIKSKMKLFEKTASDPNRFKGSSLQLIEEEKFRKMVANDFPIMTQQLRKGLIQYQKKHGGEAFFYEGEPYLRTLEEEDQPTEELLHLRLFTFSADEFDESTSSAPKKRTSGHLSQPRPPRPNPIGTPTRVSARPNTVKDKNRLHRDNNGQAVTPLRSHKPRTGSIKK